MSAAFNPFHFRPEDWTPFLAGSMCNAAPDALRPLQKYNSRFYCKFSLRDLPHAANAVTLGRSYRYSYSTHNPTSCYFPVLRSFLLTVRQFLPYSTTVSFWPTWAFRISDFRKANRIYVGKQPSLAVVL